MSKVYAKPEKLVVGGQAVIEGVMMRSKNHMAVAVRKPNQEIVIETRRINSWAKKLPLLAKPFVRGVYMMMESMVIGIRALMFSATESTEEEEEPLTNKQIVLTLAAALVFSMVLFVGIPFFLSKLITKTDFWFNVIDGVLRMAVFFAYILVISRMEDIQRVFQYHGAEHKTVHTYEAGQRLTVRNAKKHSRLHPRCGTTFLLFVVIVSVIVFSAILTDNWYLKFLYRLLLLPVVAGLSYEILRFTAKYYQNIVCRTIAFPGLLLQKLTTSEPSEDQLEVAILSLKKVLKLEEGETFPEA